MRGSSYIGKLIFVPLANLVAAAIWFFWRDGFDVYLFEPLQWSLLIIPVLSMWYFFSSDWSTPVIKISSLKGFSGDGTSWREIFKHSLFVLRMAALAFLIMAFSRPQIHDSETNIHTEGIDIVLCIDLSSSMLAMDLEPNRLEAAKIVAADFVMGRPNDRFGLVFYAGNARTMSPLTIDHGIVRQQILRKANVGYLEEDGTAIGLGLGYAVNRLRESEAPSKVIILLTDGENNVVEYPPLTYAEAASEFGVKVYTIGVGATGQTTGPVSQWGNSYQYGTVDASIDEETLIKIADITGGKYFRATDNDKLKEIYDEIDKLEKMEIEKETIYNPAEGFFPLAFMGLILLVIEFAGRHTIFWSAT